MVSPSKSGAKKRSRNGSQKVYDNPYHLGSDQQLDPYRQTMKNIVDLYMYMTFPDLNGADRRPRFQPFRMRNLSYIKSAITNRSHLKVSHRGSLERHSVTSTLTTVPPSVIFTRIKNDRLVDCKSAYVQCFQVKQLDEVYSSTLSIPNAFFEVKLDKDLKVNIDLVAMTPDIPMECSVKNEYLVVKIKFLMDTMNVSGGRRLRSVPARQVAHLDERDKGSGSEENQQIMFAVRKITSVSGEANGHRVRVGKCCLAMIAQERLGIDGDSMHWQDDRELVPRVLAEARKPGEHPILSMQVFLDPRGDCLDVGSDSQEDGTGSSCSSSVELTPAMSSFSSETQPAPVLWLHNPAPDTQVGSHEGILNIVPDDLRTKWLNAPMPEIMAWCFTMTDGNFTLPDVDSARNAISQAQAETAPPADVFRFTSRHCFLCQVKRTFQFLTSFLHHLATCHGRFTFTFKENLVPLPSSSPSSKKKRKSDSSPRMCHGLVVGLNHKFDGSHEFDVTKHYKKDIGPSRGMFKTTKVVGAWEQPPCFLVTRSMARKLRSIPPSSGIETVLYQGKFADGSFGDNPFWNDSHFHTHRYSSAHTPSKVESQQKRINEFVDLNDHEKELLGLVNGFYCSFRCLHEPRMTYPIHRVMVDELRDTLLKPACYTQFLIHLCHLKHINRLHESEWWDIIARLKEGPSYDPRTDRKHYVYAMLKALEEQRCTPDCGRKKRNDNSKEPSQERCERATSLRGGSSRNSPTPLSLLANMFADSSKVMSEPPELPSDKAQKPDSRRIKLEPVSASTLKRLEADRPPNLANNTPAISISTSSAEVKTISFAQPFPPEQIRPERYEDLEHRYYFAHQRDLKVLWNFLRTWKRTDIDWR